MILLLGVEVSEEELAKGELIEEELAMHDRLLPIVKSTFKSNL